MRASFAHDSDFFFFFVIEPIKVRDIPIVSDGRNQSEWIFHSDAHVFNLQKKITCSFFAQHPIESRPSRASIEVAEELVVLSLPRTILSYYTHVETKPQFENELDAKQLISDVQHLNWKENHRLTKRINTEEEEEVLDKKRERGNDLHDETTSRTQESKEKQITVEREQSNA